MFLDRVVVQLKAGKGGNGTVAWRREKFLPKGGPTGGNGGFGGDVILQVNSQIYSLDWYRHKKHLRAGDGGQGGPNRRQGKRGENLVLQVPCGTLVKDPETGTVLYDLKEDKERVVLAEGGKGGLGNHFFKSPTNQAPTKWTPGKEGKEIEVELELKLLADIGLVGFPNAGKSTLLNTLGRGRARVGAYPFTTLHPNLGFLETPTYERIFLADIPGILEGASANKGLGLSFLRHIERTKLLLFLLDASCIDGRHPKDDYKVLRQELESYEASILEKPYLLLLNKVDTEESASSLEAFFQEFPEEKTRSLCISAKEGLGLDRLYQTLVDHPIFQHNQK